MTSPRPLLSTLVLALCLGLAGPATAQQPEPTPAQEPPPPALPPIPSLRLYLSSLNIARYNPLGLETQDRLVLQKRLFDSPSLLLRDTFVSGALSLKASPAMLKIGPLVEVQPVAMLNLRAGYEYVQYFGTMGFLQSYPDALRDYSDDVRDANNDAAYSTSGHHFLVEPTLQAKVGPIALRTKLAIEYWNVALRDGSRGTFYDPTLDTLVPGRGWVITNDTDLILLSGQWTVGARLTGVWPRYEDGGGTVQAGGLGDNSHLRVGPLVAYALNTREGTMFNRPTVLAIAGWYLKHPNRETAMPYLLVGFGFSSDFMGGR